MPDDRRLGRLLRLSARVGLLLAVIAARLRSRGPQVDNGISPPDIGSTRPDGLPQEEAPLRSRALRYPWLGNASSCIAADCALLAIVAFAVVAHAANADGAIRLVSLLLAMCLVPGAALLTFVQVEDVIEGLALAIGIGLALEASGTLAMIWTGFWHPLSWIAGVVAVACLLLALDLRRNLFAAQESARH